MGALFKKPEPQKPARMPVDETDPAVQAAQDAERRRIMARSGRQSTILTEPGNRGTGGSSAYSNARLGQT